ncbi:MAG: hypothetical protein EBS61_12025 [Betaproteobacteria bacterium]|nr:hypothetical protein [Betaproteobacteria bacterium]
MSFADLDSLPKDPALAVERLSQQLRQWSASYYRGDHGSIPDALYDRWFERLLELEKQHPELVREDSPSQRVGTTPDDAIRWFSGQFALRRRAADACCHAWRRI